MPEFSLALNLNQWKKPAALLLVTVMITELFVGCFLYQKSEAQGVDIIGGWAQIGDFFAGIGKWITQNATDLYNAAGTWATALKALWDKAQTILKEALKFAWERVRRMLINMLVNDIISWIQGGGKPRFVTDWQSFLTTAADKAAGEVINKYAPFLCSSFSATLQIALVKTTFDEQVTCTLSDVTGNIENFFTDFSKGGWTGWLKVSEAQNNIFGATLLMWDKQYEMMGKAQEAAQNEANSAAGFLGDKVCSQRRCSAGGAVENYSGSSLGWKPDELDQGGGMSCDCLKWEIRTPGRVAGDALQQALGIDIPMLINAKEFSEFAGAIIDAVINRAIREGVALMKSTSEGKSNSPTNASQPGVKTAATKASLNVDISNYTRAAEIETYLPGIKDQLRLAKENIAKIKGRMNKNFAILNEIVNLWEEVKNLAEQIEDKGCDPFTMGGPVTPDVVQREITAAEAMMEAYEKDWEIITNEDEVGVEYGYKGKTETIIVKKGHEYLIDEVLDAVKEYYDAIKNFTSAYDASTATAGHKPTNEEIDLEIKKDKAVKLFQLLTDSTNTEFSEIIRDATSYAKKIGDLLGKLYEDKGGVKDCDYASQEDENGVTLNAKYCVALGFKKEMGAYLGECEVKLISPTPRPSPSPSP